MKMDCEQTQVWIQDRIDGRLVDGAGLEAMERHLVSCADCRRFRTEMTEIHVGLASLPELEFPEDALEEVWDRTIRKQAAGDRSNWRWIAAVAAVLLVALAGSLFGPWNDEPEYSPTEVARATAEARAALGLVGKALQRSEDAAVQKVLGGKVTPALEKITIGLPEAGSGK